MSLPRDKAWFYAKRYGYGWGLPARWQGWVALLSYFAAILLGSLWAQTHTKPFIIGVAIFSAGLVALCYWKGEEPRWRWGDSDSKG